MTSFEILRCVGRTLIVVVACSTNSAATLAAELSDLRVIDEFIRLHPQSPKGYQMRAEYYSSHMDDEKEERDIAKVIQLDPHNYGSRVYHAKILADMGKGDAAIAEFRVIIAAKNEASADAARELSILFQKQNRYKEALEALELSRKLGEPEQKILTNLSECASLSGNGKKALEYANKLIKTRELVGRQCRAQALMSLGRSQEALADYDVIVRKEEDQIRKNRATQPWLVPTVSLEKLYGERAQCYEKLHLPNLAKLDRQRIQNLHSQLYRNLPFRTNVGDKH